MATEQIMVRVPKPLLSDLDDLVASEVYDSRAAAIRAGIKAVVKPAHQRQIDQAIIDGYRGHPPTKTESTAALISLRNAILEEPW